MTGCSHVTITGLSLITRMKQLQEIELTNCPAVNKDLIRYMHECLPETCTIITWSIDNRRWWLWSRWSPYSPFSISFSSSTIIISIVTTKARLSVKSFPLPLDLFLLLLLLLLLLFPLLQSSRIRESLILWRQHLWYLKKKNNFVFFFAFWIQTQTLPSNQSLTQIDYRIHQSWSNDFKLFWIFFFLVPEQVFFSYLLIDSVSFFFLFISPNLFVK